MQRFVEKDLGLEFKFDTMINPRLDCSKSPLDVRLTPAEVVELNLSFPERAKEWEHFADRCGNPKVHPDRADYLYACGAGKSSFAIDPYGKLHACLLSTGDSHDLRQNSFQEGWEKYLAALRQKKTSRQTKCAICRLKSMCGVCPANCELESADAEAPVDYLCRVAHLRSYAIGLPLAPHGACEYCKVGSGYAEMMETVKGLKDG